MSAPAETVAGLREQIATARADVARLSPLADALVDERRAALVEEDDRRLAVVEKELLTVERDRERARLKLGALEERLRVAEVAERRATLDRKRREMAAECKAQLDRAARVDSALAELAEAAAAWWEGTIRVRTKWVADRHGDPLVPEFIAPIAPLLGTFPLRLANLLRLAGANPYGHRPLAELDPAARALALLDSPPPPEPVRAPEQPAHIIHSTPGGVTVVHQPAGA